MIGSRSRPGPPVRAAAAALFTEAAAGRSRDACLAAARTLLARDDDALLPAAGWCLRHYADMLTDDLARRTGTGPAAGEPASRRLAALTGPLAAAGLAPDRTLPRLLRQLEATATDPATSPRELLGDLAAALAALDATADEMLAATGDVTPAAVPASG